MTRTVTETGPIDGYGGEMLRADERQLRRYASAGTAVARSVSQRRHAKTGASHPHAGHDRMAAFAAQEGRGTLLVASDWRRTMALQIIHEMRDFVLCRWWTSL